MIKNIQYESFEFIQVSFEHGGRKFMFIVVYRPPNIRSSLFMNDFRLFLERVNTVESNTFICRDFDCWFDDPENHDANEFKDLMATFQFENKVEEVTSITGHMLDLVFCNMEYSPVRDICVDEHNTVSPVHKLVSFVIPFNKDVKQRKKIIFRDKKSLQPDGVIRRITDAIINKRNELCPHNTLIKECVKCFTELYNVISKEEYDTACPVIEKEIIVKDNAPWFNSELKTAKREKRRAEYLWRRRRTSSSRRIYIEAKNRYNSRMKQRKSVFYRNKIKDVGNDMNKLYSVLDNLTGHKKKNRLPEGYNDKDLAMKFLEFFDNKISRVISSFSSVSTQRTVSISRLNPELKLTRFCGVDMSKLKLIFNKVKLTYSGGDPFPMSDFKNSSNFDSILMVFLELVNLCIAKKNFPESEKLAIIKPVVKGSLDSQMLSSYRPVSNLSFLSKIIENVLLEQLQDYLLQTQVLPDQQSAYRQLYSTETALCSVVSDLILLMDNDKCGILILLDLSAAFDTVVHSLLLEDLEMIGIEGDALELLKNYIEGRTYCVQIGNAQSETKSLSRGVPQGSVLGPILFCIYTIELSYILSRHGVFFKLFADDTQFYLTFNNVEETVGQLRNIIKDVKDWMMLKQLKLNEDKTECLIVGKRGDLRRLDEVESLNIEGNEIKVTKSVKDLGVVLDSNLSMKEQIDKVVRVAGYHLRNIAFVKKYIDESSLIKLIHNHVISRLDYCNSLYYALPNYQLNRLQRIMNRAARLIKGTTRFDRITPVLMELHWLPIKARIAFKICVMVYQALRHGKPDYIRKLLSEHRPETAVLLRSSDDPFRLEEPRCNLQMGFRAFRTSAPRIFNRLPVEVKDSENIDIFKRKLKTFFFGDCYTNEGTISEFYRL